MLCVLTDKQYAKYENSCVVIAKHSGVQLN